MAARVGVSAHRLYQWIKAVPPGKTESQANEQVRAGTKSGADRAPGDTAASVLTGNLACELLLSLYSPARRTENMSETFIASRTDISGFPRANRPRGRASRMLAHGRWKD